MQKHCEILFLIVLLLYLRYKHTFMDSLLSNLRITVPSCLYVKDPESSDLGKKIIEQSILQIDELGFEKFTFKKLGEAIGSNESSIYRYFENKHKLLMYLCSWYWGWLEYQVVIHCYSIQNPKERLDKALEIISQKVVEDSNFTFVNEPVLSRIIINENAKSFHTKEVDTENNEGAFGSYKRLVLTLEKIIKGISSRYPYPKSLANTIIETANHQHFLRDHFKSITENSDVAPTKYLTHLVQKVLQ